MCVWSHLSTLLLNYAEVYFLFKLVTQITARREKGGERKIRFKWFKSEGIALATLVVKPVSDLPTSGWISKVFTTWPFRFWDTQVWCAKLARRESNVVLYTCNFRNIKDLLFALKIILTLRQLSDIRKKKKLYQFKWFETYWMFSPNCKLSSVFFFYFLFFYVIFVAKQSPNLIWVSTDVPPSFFYQNCFILAADLTYSPLSCMSWSFIFDVEAPLTPPHPRHRFLAQTSYYRLLDFMCARLWLPLGTGATFSISAFSPVLAGWCVYYLSHRNQIFLYDSWE